MRRRRSRLHVSLSGSKTLFICAILFATMLRLALLVRSDELFYARPFIEDGYYSLTVARSLAHGQGLSIQGLHPTNGIQPLLVFLYAPLFLFPDHIAVRLCLLLNIVIELSLAVLLYSLIVQSRRSQTDVSFARLTGGVAAILFLWSYSSTVYTLNGLETGLAALMTLLSFSLYRRWFVHSSGTMKRALLLGLVLGVTVLARIDTAFFAAAIALHSLVMIPRESLVRRIPLILVTGMVCLLVSLPWWWYNVSTFGHIVPTSGLSQSTDIPLGMNLEALLHFIANQFLLIAYTPWQYGLTLIDGLILVPVFLFAVLVLTAKRWREAVTDFMSRVHRRWDLRGSSTLLMFSALLALYYIAAFGAPHFLARYLFIVHILVTCYAAMLFAEFWQRIAERNLLIRTVTIASLASLLLIVFLMRYSWNFDSAKARDNDFLAVSKWIQQHVTQGELVGMGQSGTASFFNGNVINLDGKVNGDVFLAAREHKYCEYISSKHFDYLIDWRKFFDDLVPCDVLAEYAYLDSVGRFLIYKRIPVRPDHFGRSKN